MKYIKTYESKKIKNGDYVIKNSVLYPNLPKNLVGIVFDKKNKILFTEYLVIYDFPFNKVSYRFFDDDIRLATQEEIEQYKLEKEANKYNI